MLLRLPYGKSTICSQFDMTTYMSQIIHISYIIPEAVRSSSSVCVWLGQKFCIQLALPISPEIMDEYRSLRRLNDRIKVSDMMKLFAGGATTHDMTF